MITDVSENEISMRTTMIKQARNSYFLCDASKLGNTYVFHLCHKSEVTKVICDQPLSNE